MRRRKRGGRSVAEHAQLGFRLRPRDAGSQPADSVDRTALERIVRGAERQRRPGVVVDRVPETLRHHTDHGRRCVPQCHDRTDDVVATAKDALPYVVAEHDHAGCSRPLVGVEQGATKQGRHTCRAERGGSEFGHPDRLGSRVADDEIPSVRAVRSQLLDRSQLAPPFEEVAHDASLGLVGQGIPRLDQDEPVAFGQRDRWRQELARQVVPASPNPDRNGERQSARERQARVLQEHPQPEPVILQGALQPRRDPDVTHSVAGERQAAQRAPRRRGRRGRIEPARLQLLPLHLQVEPQLVVELALVTITLEQVA